MSKNPFEKLLGKLGYRKVWEQADDVIRRHQSLSELYNNVPADLDVQVDTLEIHSFPKNKRKAILKWLDSGN